MLKFEKSVHHKIKRELGKHFAPESRIRKLIIKLLPWTLRLFVAASLAFLYLVFTTYGKNQKQFVYGTTYDPWYAMSLGLDWEQTYLDILDDLGVKHLRLSAFWDQIEPQRDQYHWEDFEWMLTEADKRNVEIIMAIGRKLPRWPECHDPAWLHDLKSSALKQEQLEMLKETVLALRHHRSIEVWQVENEAFFPFGNCPLADPRFVAKEIALVRSLDSRPIITSDSGEAGNWIIPGQLADKLAISMYRKVWLDWAGYITWPVPAWNYKLRASLAGLKHENVWGTELQCEPWAPGPIPLYSDEEIAKTMDQEKFIKNIKYAQRAGFTRIYFWGVEWWAYEKARGNDWYWQYTKKYFNESKV